jgi:hypothetical protein
MYVAAVRAGTTFAASPPRGDDAVHAVAGAEVLPQEADGGLRHRERVRGVDAVLGKCGRVRSAARVVHVELGERERRRLDRIDRRGDGS